MNHVASYPLHWPDGWAQTPHHKRRHAAFKTSLAAARDGVLEEVRLMGGTQPVISTNIATYQRRGIDIPYADQSAAKDAPGVAVYFTLKGQPQVFACDRWKTVSANLQAIRKTIEALRGIERWGSSEMMSRVFQGFAALPPAPEVQSWSEILGDPGYWGLQQLEARYRELAKIYHPDRGGDPEKMAKLNWAIGQAREEKGR
jgi:hypothetical protein